VAACVSGFGVCSECRLCTLHGTQNTRHNLKNTLPQHCETYNDVSSLINPTKV